MQLQGATAVCVFDMVCACVTALVFIACVVCMPFVFRPTALRGTGHCCERPDCVGKAPLLDAAVQNGVDSSTFSVSTWWLVAGFQSCSAKGARRTISGACFRLHATSKEAEVTSTYTTRIHEVFNSSGINFGVKSAKCGIHYTLWFSGSAP